MDARLANTVVLLFGLWPCAHQAAAQSLIPIGIEAGCEARAGSDITEFSAVLCNSGTVDIAVTIGVSLNGVVFHPALLRVVATDPTGTTDVLHYSVGDVEGRVQPWVVVVPAGGAYRVRLPTERLFLGRPSARRARFARVTKARLALAAGPRVLDNGETAVVPEGAQFATGEYASLDIRVPAQCARASGGK